MLINCADCEVRELACDGCVVTALLGVSGEPMEIGEGERRALGVLADEGMVPPLRLTLPSERAS